MSDPAGQTKEALNDALFLDRAVKVDKARAAQKDWRSGGGQRRVERYHGQGQTSSDQYKDNRDNSYE